MVSIVGEIKRFPLEYFSFSRFTHLTDVGDGALSQALGLAQGTEYSRHLKHQNFGPVCFEENHSKYVKIPLCFL